MKNLLLIVALCLCAHHFCGRKGTDPQTLGRWNEQKHEADNQLASELLGYQASLAEPIYTCPRTEAGHQSAIRQGRSRVQAARERAIAVLQHKPGALTVPEAQRLSYYTTGLPDRLARGLPGCEEMP